jgi:hypothetical protein
MHGMMGHFGMDDDPNHQQSSEQHGNYSNDVWAGIPANSYSSPQQTSPIYEYQNYQLMNHGLPLSLPEQPTFARMPPPPAHQQTLLPLLPAPTWMSNTPSFPATMPSMLTNPGGHSTRPVRMAPNSARVRASKPSAPPGGRKCLTDEAKRQICQIHMDRPDFKQAQIGGELLYSCQIMDANVCIAMFNVERRYAR